MDSGHGHDSPERRPPSRAVLAAATLAVMLLAGSGYAFHAMGRYYAQPLTSVPLPAGTLERLPMDVGPWRGRDVAMDPRMLKATDADAMLTRTYVRAGDNLAVNFYVAYGIRGRDLVPHRPEVCYPGAGWTLESNQPRLLALPDGQSLPCRVLRFSRPGLGNQTVRVMNFFLVDGRYYDDLSGIRSLIWKGSDQIRYMTRVMLTMPDRSTGLDDEPTAAMADLVGHLVGPMSDLMPQAIPVESTQQPAGGPAE